MDYQNITVVCSCSDCWTSQCEEWWQTTIIN